MPIPLPDLDDRTYADLADEARALLPALLPEWTDHNPSDPGIVLVELLAWLTEMLVFQVDEIPPASTEVFLRLLNGPGWTRPEGTSLDEAVHRTLRDLREVHRAVTPGDYEHLALVAWPRSGGERLARACCVPRRDLASTDPARRAELAPGHVSLVVVPAPGPGSGERHPEPATTLLPALADFLAPRRTLTTRLHVVGPAYVDVGVAATLALHADAPPGAALDAAQEALAALFDPLTGGPDGVGWPFGRDPHVSEVYAVLDRMPLVDHIEGVRLTGPCGAVELDADALVRLAAVDLVAVDVQGERHTPGTGAR